MVRSMIDASDDPERTRQKLARQIPLGEIGEADDVAHMIVYLASDESKFVTGARIRRRRRSYGTMSGRGCGPSASPYMVSAPWPTLYCSSSTRGEPIPAEWRAFSERWATTSTSGAPAGGDPLPQTMDGHAGAVVFGGPMSANDDSDFIRAEIDWIPTVLKSDKPFLGICLGAQLLTRALGGAVWTHPQGLSEVGYYRVRPTEAGAPLFRDVTHMYQWHREGMDLPRGAERLASSERFENQAYRFGNAYALQFHPEVTYGILRRWTSGRHLEKAARRSVAGRAAQRSAPLRAGRRALGARVPRDLDWRRVGRQRRGDRRSACLEPSAVCARALIRFPRRSISVRAFRPRKPTHRCRRRRGTRCRARPLARS